MLVPYAARHTQLLQKALQQRNVRSENVFSDITGATGLLILDAIPVGERDPVKLVQRRDACCRNSVEIIARALRGRWRDERFCAQRQALTLCRKYHQQIAQCDRHSDAHLATFEDQSDGQPLPQTPRPATHENEAQLSSNRSFQFSTNHLPGLPHAPNKLLT